MNSHVRFLEDLVQLINAFMKQKDNYMLSDRYVAEFMEKYERLNLQGYNSGGYAYSESLNIFNKAEEEQKRQLKEGMQDTNMTVDPSDATGIQSESLVRKPTLMEKIKKSVGLKVTDAMSKARAQLPEEVEMLNDEGQI